MADALVPACPRCDYDQSGAVASWPQDACPLRGTCPECGYDFAWREVFSPVEKRNPRFVEHCRWLRLPDSAWRTLAWTILPWRFWKRIRLHHIVCWWRWPLWALFTFIALHAATASLLAFASWRQSAGAWGPPGRFNWWQIADHLTGPLFVFEGGWEGRLFGSSPGPLRWNVVDWSPPAIVMSVMSLLLPVFVLALPQTRRRAKVRIRHVLRAAVFQWWWVLLPTLPLFSLALMWSIDPGTARSVDFIWLFYLTHTWAIPLIGVGIFWQYGWWASALQLGWRIRGGAALAAFLVLGAAVVAILVASLTDITLLERVLRPSSWFTRGGLYW